MKKFLDKRNFIDQLMLLYNDLERFVYVLVKNNDLKSDIVQNTIEIALEKYHQLRSESALKSWLFSIAKNEVRKYYKKNPPAINYEDVQLGMLENPPSDSLNDVSDMLLQAENVALIREAIQKLDLKYQQIIFLHYYEGMTLKEISKTLNTNYNTIKTLHRRALERLKELLFPEKGGAF